VNEDLRKATNIIKTLKRHGHEAFVVGGAVRDIFLNKEPHDFDVATSATPDELKALFETKAIGVGESFGIVIVNGIEVATFRADVGGSDGRHPDEVRLVTDVREDLARRDFTMNAMAMDPTPGHFLPVDPFGGLDDIQNKVIRFVGDPAERIKEDHLRVLRAIRFMSKLGFSFEANTERTIVEQFNLSGVSVERITKEFEKILLGDFAPRAIDFMARNGLLWKIIPELENSLGPHDSPWHLEADDFSGNSIWAHIFRVFENACEATRDDSDEDKLLVRLAALLHDVGKAFVREVVDYTNNPNAAKFAMNVHSRFLNHDKVGAKMTKEILTRMRFPTKVVDEVTELVFMHMIMHDVEKMKKVHKVRRLLGRSDIELLLKLGQADDDASVNNIEEVQDHGKTARKVAEWRAKFPEMLPRPLVTGDDLIAAGLKPGIGFKEALDKAFDEQLCGSSNKVALINRAKSEFFQVSNGIG
jgi:putative nucleotidyltransferase with HDIG domain